MYSKLFAKIVTSSIWLAPHPTRIVWITLLACKDKDGFAAFSAIGNLARIANVTIEEATEAVRVLESPDPESGNPENEGRRIERVPGGWIVLNAKIYDEIVTAEHSRALGRKRSQAFRERNARNADALPERNRNAPVTLSDSDSDTDTDTDKIPSPTDSVSSPVSAVLRVFDHWRSTWNHPRAKLDRKLMKRIADRLKEFSEADLCQAVSGYLNSPHHCGQNERDTVYDSLGLFLRDAEHVNTGLRFYARPTTKPETTMDRIARRAREASHPKETNSERESLQALGSPVAAIRS